MTDIPYRTTLIVGAGPGISASVARGLASAGLIMGIAAAERRPSNNAELLELRQGLREIGELQRRGRRRR